MRTADLYEFAAREENRQRFDLLIAHALLDLLHLPAALPSLLGMLRPGGLFYFSINFDGASLFLPGAGEALSTRQAGQPHRGALRTARWTRWTGSADEAYFLVTDGIEPRRATAAREQVRRKL